MKKYSAVNLCVSLLFPNPVRSKEPSLFIELKLKQHIS